MSIPTPRELLAVLVHTDTRGITATFHLGEEFDPSVGAEWFTYGLAVSGSDRATTKHFIARLSPTERKALVFDFESSTQANYHASHVDVHETSVIAGFIRHGHAPGTVQRRFRERAAARTDPRPGSQPWFGGAVSARTRTTGQP
jgi:hypothetical protein